jgi:hypothetical protein
MLGPLKPSEIPFPEEYKQFREKVKNNMKCNQEKHRHLISNTENLVEKTANTKHKRGRGWPLGSKNKPKQENMEILSTFVSLSM